jgi:hypothetical protein
MLWYMYSDARALEGKRKLGGRNRVALVQEITKGLDRVDIQTEPTATMSAFSWNSVPLVRRVESRFPSL